MAKMLSGVLCRHAQTVDTAHFQHRIQGGSHCSATTRRNMYGLIGFFSAKVTANLQGVFPVWQERWLFGNFQVHCLLKEAGAIGILKECIYRMGFRLLYLQHHTLMWCFVCCALHLRFVLRPRVHGRELTLQDYGIDPWSTFAQSLRAQLASATASDGLIQLRAIVTTWVTGQKVTVKVHFFEMGGLLTM